MQSAPTGELHRMAARNAARKAELRQLHASHFQGESCAALKGKAKNLARNLLHKLHVLQILPCGFLSRWPGASDIGYAPPRQSVENPTDAFSRAGFPDIAHRLRLCLRASRLSSLGIFDAEWYAAQYPEAAPPGCDPAVFWLELGWRDAQDPGPLFDTRWYLGRYAGQMASATNPALHFIDTGAAAGLDPNPLLDSDWYLSRYPEAAASGLNPLTHYVRTGAAAGLDPGPMFDSDWYIEEHGVVPESGVTPLGHYLAIGARNGCDPNPLFDTTVYMEAHGLACDRREAPRHFFESDLAYAPGAYRGAEVLLERQAAYRADTDMQLLADKRAQPRRFAVYLQCGAGSIHPRWLTGGDRSWDLIVNHYDPTHVGALPDDVEFRQAGRQPGTKFTSFHTFLSRWNDIAAGYDFIMLLDDDILLSEADIDALFRVAEQHGLDLAQPALTQSSHALHDLFYRKGTGVRSVDGVEIMMPLLSRKTLLHGGPLFAETISGWGLDTALGKLVTEYLGGKAAIIDAIAAEHCKPVDMHSGPFYRMLAAAGIYPWLEARHLRTKYGANYSFREL